MKGNATTADVVPLQARVPGAPDQIRTPPVAHEAEIAVLAAILQNNIVIERVQALGLQGAHFADGRNGALYDACATLFSKGRVANAVTLKDFATNAGIFAGDSGFGMLRELQGLALPLGGAADMAREILAAFQKRELLGIFETRAAMIYSGDLELEVGELIAGTSSDLNRLEDAMGVTAGPQAISGFFSAALQSADRAYKTEGLVGVPTGLRDLDDRLGGLQNSDLVIVAGRPSMGKTALGVKIAFNAARRLKEVRDEKGGLRRADGGRTLVYSLEMSGEQLANRLLGDVCSIPSDKIRRGTIDDADFPTLAAAANNLASLPLHIDDSGHMTVAKMRASALRHQRKHGKIHLIVIDYLQLMSADQPAGGRGGEQNRVQEISAITRGLKALAKELDCPIVALSQLSRMVEQRDDKRPQLSDLRESGSIEQDSDVVLFCYRESYYHERAEPRRRAEESDSDFNTRFENWTRRGEEIRNRGDVIVGKQRHGSIGTVTLGWRGEFTRWLDLPQHEDRLQEGEA